MINYANESKEFAEISDELTDENQHGLASLFGDISLQLHIAENTGASVDETLKNILEILKAAAVY